MDDSFCIKDFTSSDLLMELEMLKNRVANEMIANKDYTGPLQREYTALYMAYELAKADMTVDKSDTLQYDKAINELSTYITNKELSNELECLDSLKLALKSLEKVRDVKIKIKMHNAISEVLST